MLSQEQYWNIDKHYSKASQVLDEAKGLAEKYQHDLVVRRAQEAFELLLKTMLLFLGRDYPKDHDVGKVFYDALGTLQELGITTERVARTVLRSKTLQLWRAPSFYGDERLKVATLFGEPEAALAIRWAEDMRTDCYFVKTKAWERFVRKPE